MMAIASYAFLSSFPSKAPLKIHERIAACSIRLSQRENIYLQRQLDSVFVRQHTHIQGIKILLENLRLDLINTVTP